jgi:hypothetical protein
VLDPPGKKKPTFSNAVSGWSFRREDSQNDEAISRQSSLTANSTLTRILSMTTELATTSKNCYVTGTVDFIFGYDRSFYEAAELVAHPDFGNPGTITAQKRNETTLDTVTNKLHYHVC